MIVPAALRPLALALASALALAGTPWSPEDYARTQWPLAAELSPGGRTLAYVVAVATPKGGRSELWRVDLARGGPRPVAPALAQAKTPRFSPAGRLAFLGAGTDGRFGIRAEDGRPLTPASLTVADFQWRDAGRIVFAAEPRRPERPDDTVVVDAEVVPLGLWELTLKTRTCRRISDLPDRVTLLSVSPDGRYAAARHEQGTRWEYDQRTPPVTRIWDLESGTSTALPTRLRTGDPGQPEGGFLAVPDGFVWARDSRSCLCTYPQSAHPWLSQAWVEAAFRVALPDWRMEPLKLAWERGLGPSVQALEHGSLALLEDGLARRAALLPETGGAPALLAGPKEGNPELLLMDPAGASGAALLSSAARPPQWYAVTLAGTALKVLRRLTRLNPHLQDKAFARVEACHYGGVEGMLYYPAGYVPGRAYPLVLNPHGGPFGADRDEWNENDHHPAQLHAQAGAFLLKLNYSGSSGYGRAFAERLMGHYLEPELDELRAALKEIVAQGLADPARIAVTGWSNGAILASALAVATPFPLRAMVLGAGDVNEVSDWGNCQFGEAFSHYYLGRSLIEDPELYWRRSTLPRLGGIATATLILHGDKDREVPTEQSWEAYRWLQQAGKAPVRLVLFPGEGHEFAGSVHIRRRLEEEVAWFRRYLFEAP